MEWMCAERQPEVVESEGNVLRLLLPYKTTSDSFHLVTNQDPGIKLWSTHPVTTSLILSAKVLPCESPGSLRMWSGFKGELKGKQRPRSMQEKTFTLWYHGNLSVKWTAVSDDLNTDMISCDPEGKDAIITLWHFSRSCLHHEDK